MSTTPLPPSPVPPPLGTPGTLTARTPEDLLAVVPVVLGFLPAESVVMLTFGADHAFHGRTDLPPPGAGQRAALDQVAETLLAPARRHRVRRVVLVFYTDDADRAEAAGRVLARRFRSAGIAVLEMLRADGRRWYPLLGRRPGVPEWGVRYDVSNHPFVVEAVLRGRVTLGSRAELAASLDPCPERVAAVAELLAAYPGEWSQQALPSTAEILREGDWVEQTVRRHVGSGTAPDEADAARILRGIQVKRVRDAAWSLIARAEALRHVAFWTDLVRRCPEPLLAPPATLLGWAAWQAGNGALAWCAVERAARVDQRYTMMLQLSTVLQQALPPDALTGFAGFDWRLGLSA